MQATRMLLALALLAPFAPGCGGASVDRDTTLTRIREALTEELAPGDTQTIEDHNQLVEDVRDGNVMEGMRRHEVQAALGRGDECGTRAICSEHGFRPTDWIYEVGQRDGVAWGPTMVVGFGQQGMVEQVYTLTRR